MDMPPLVSILPDTTRAVFHADIGTLFAGDAAGAVAKLLRGQGDAALATPFAALERLTLGADLEATMDRVLLAQTTRAGEGVFLVAEPKTRQLDDVFDSSQLVEVASYKRREIHAVRDSDLQVSLLSDGRLLVGRAGAIRAAIDTLDGDNPGVGSSAIGAYLSRLDANEPLSFVAGLPALYGDVYLRGDGVVTLRHARALTGGLTLGADSFEGQLEIYTDHASEYVARFNALVANAPTSSLRVGDAGAIEIEIPRSAIEKQPEEVLASRGLMKQLVHAMDAVDYADGVMHGAGVPWMNFDVGGDPNSIFINFEFRDRAQVEAFEANVLPAGFKLAPLRILDTDEPTFFLVLNIYNSSGGLVAGARAEWSVFVEDPENGHPRFLVVEAKAENVSADSVNLITSPEPVSHVFEDGAIVSRVAVEDPDGGEEQPYFHSRISWPQMPEARVSLAREFVAANDFIYWGNGVADRVLYNASMHNRDAVLIPEDQMTIRDDSPWAGYVDPLPKHTYVYLNPLEIVISPWWNLDAEYLDVTEDYRQSLIEFKDNFYPAAVLGIAEAAVAGEGDALAEFRVGTSGPTVYYNFEVTDPTGFVEAAGLPEGTALVPIKLLDDEDPPRFYLSLRVYDVDGMAAGRRAEWRAFVAGDNGRPATMIVDLLTEEATPDPELLLRLPGVVDHDASGARVTTVLRSETIDFEASVDLSGAHTALPSLDFVEAGDWVCRRNGVCDKIYYDGQVMEEPITVAGADAAEVRRLAAPWVDFAAPEPLSVLVREGVQRYAWNPWQNVRVVR